MTPVHSTLAHAEVKRSSEMPKVLPLPKPPAVHCKLSNKTLAVPPCTCTLCTLCYYSLNCCITCARCRGFFFTLRRCCLLGLRKKSLDIFTRCQCCVSVTVVLYFNVKLLRPIFLTSQSGLFLKVSASEPCTQVVIQSNFANKTSFGWTWRIALLSCYNRYLILSRIKTID